MDVGGVEFAPTPHRPLALGDVCPPEGDAEEAVRLGHQGPDGLQWCFVAVVRHAQGTGQQPPVLSPETYFVDEFLLGVVDRLRAGQEDGDGHFV